MKLVPYFGPLLRSCWAFERDEMLCSRYVSETGGKYDFPIFKKGSALIPSVSL